jgi:hypothetical protein
MKRRIKKGNHYSTIIPHLKFGRTVAGTVKFIGDFFYELSPEKQSDTNKLIGLSDNWSHHKDSIRIGWRCNDKIGKFQVMAIVYQNGHRTIKLIDEFAPNKQYFFQVSITNKNYIVIFNDKSIVFDRFSMWIGPRVILQPYFGGTEVAPKDFNFEFNLL